MGLLRRKDKSAEAELAAEPDIDVGEVTALGHVEARTPVRVVGEVTRIRSRPGHGIPALTVTLEDDSGKVLVVWTGRRSIGGVSLGRCLLIEGMASNRGGALEFTNPTYTLLPRHLGPAS